MDYEKQVSSSQIFFGEHFQRAKKLFYSYEPLKSIERQTYDPGLAVDNLGLGPWKPLPHQRWQGAENWKVFNSTYFNFVINLNLYKK